MSVRVDHIERYIPEETKDAVHRAAEYLGQAAAMGMNLTLAGADSHKIAVWAAEEKVWQRRQNALIRSAPLGRQELAEYAICTSGDNYQADLVTTIHKDEWH